MKENKKTYEKVKPAETIGTKGVIGQEETEKAISILKKYKEGKTALENRIVDNEQWFKLRHWEQLRGDKGDKNASAWKKY